MKWLDRISLPLLALIAVPLALAPFFPEPHLLQKIKMLAAGTLTQSTDFFDLVLHGLPTVLLIAKLVRMRTIGSGDPRTEPPKKRV